MIEIPQIDKQVMIYLLFKRYMYDLKITSV